MRYLGLGKTLYNSSAALIGHAENEIDVELHLSERLTRKKATGIWPEQAIRGLLPLVEGKDFRIGENRDVMDPSRREDELDQRLPFYTYLKSTGLENMTRKSNSNLEFISHHRCHAAAATLMSPFEKAIVVVIDGAGNLFEEQNEHIENSPDLGGEAPRPGVHEECSIYLMDHGRLKPVAKRWRKFDKSFSEGAGIFYENVAKFIFGNVQASGKVMGLAPFAKSEFPIENRVQFLKNLVWTKAFQGKTRKDWDQCGRFEEFAGLAALTQASFEEDMWELMFSIRQEWPEYDNLILTGGCALNCTFNGKLLAKNIFSEIYVPPFPGDESIGLGAAAELYLRDGRFPWKTWDREIQHGYFGPRTSEPSEKQIQEEFKGFKISKPNSLSSHVTDILVQGDFVAWFQGRSESGPRSLGNRSILADPARAGVKDRLNAQVKFREDFRPYGSSVLHERAHEYFDVPKGFDNPYMSFAVPTRKEWKDRLREVTHVDGTSRMQTVRPGQNKKFHELISTFGDRTGLFAVLNTSLNVMGEPIVETISDAKNFLEKTPVHGLAIGDFYIERSKRL